MVFFQVFYPVFGRQEVHFFRTIPVLLRWLIPRGGSVPGIVLDSMVSKGGFPLFRMGSAGPGVAAGEKVYDRVKY